jgi:hypothetical protein
MCHMRQNSSSFPVARAVAVESFRKTMSASLSEHLITEIGFSRAWHSELSADPGLFESGWYDPPPLGIAVISDDAEHPERVSFTSLRLREFWPGERRINFQKDILYAYCSPVSRVDLSVGDFGITLYFGNSARILDHIKKTFNAVTALLSDARGIRDSRTLYRRSVELFKGLGLRNDVVSVTDKVPNDLGHSLPIAKASTTRELTTEQKQHLRSSRLFINDQGGWDLSGVQWFTIEPQLRSLNEPHLPQISYHFVCSRHGNIFRVSQDVYDLYGSFSLRDLTFSEWPSL